MIYSVELRLKAIEGSGNSEVTGYHIYAFFLNLIERVNSLLAEKLHQDSSLKSFTLSPLKIHGPSRRRGILVEGESATIRITFLNDEIFASLADAIWRLPSDALLTLGESKVVCQGLSTTPDQSLNAITTSFENLVENASNEPKLILNFLSPTTFRSKGERNIIFPEPSLVFNSLLTRWNACVPSSLKLNLGETISSALRLSTYRIHTRMLNFGSYQELGFCGNTSYGLITGVSEEQLKALNTLADFAFFSGVGAKTTMGMGQCRRLRDARSLSHRAGGNPEKRG